jgi:hypothetical protein
VRSSVREWREALRERLGEAIRNAVAEGGMGIGEQPPYVH